MGKVEVVGTNWEAFLMLLFYSCIVPLGFLPGNFGLLLPGKASCDRVVLPNLWCMPGLIVFPQSTSPRAHLLVVGMLLFMSDINQPSLPTPFFFKFCSWSISVFMALSTVSHCINSPDNSSFSQSVLPILSLPYWSFQFYILQP